MQHPLQKLPGAFIRAGRILRKSAFLLLEPFDYVACVINQKKDFPPLNLRRYAGPLRSFESSGAEFLAYLKLLCKVQPHERILDVGCGCGLVALYLKHYLDSNARYFGIDIHKPSIKWCQRNITPKNSGFSFRHIDVKNQTYNPRGQVSAEEFTFPFEERCFDVILAKSLFTHMRPPEVDNYLREIARLLSNNGRCLATFFLLNEVQEELAKKGLNKLNFIFGNQNWRCVYKNSPESAVAFKEKYILDLLQKHGLKLMAPIFYGHWSGIRMGLSFQDILLIGKHS